MFQAGIPAPHISLDTPDTASLKKCMLKRTLPLAVLFADISGGKSLYTSLGDVDAHNLVSSCITALSGIAADHQGTIIKTIGDEVMCTFPSALQALEASIAMQKARDTVRPVHEGKQVTVNIRIGVHWGQVIYQNYDVFGDAVNVAARIVARARIGQILTTQQTIHELPGDCGVENWRLVRLNDKSKDSESVIYEVIWDEENQTLVAANDITMQVISCRLHLQFGKKELYLDANNPVATLGRQLQNDIVFSDVIASRLHARIEHRNGKFVLVDQSTNGTYVSLDGKKTMFVHNDEIVLSSHGTISMGREQDEASPDVIHYTHEYIHQLQNRIT